MGADKLIQEAKSAGVGMLQSGLQAAKQRRDDLGIAYQTAQMSMRTAAVGTIVGMIMSFCAAYFFDFWVPCTKCACNCTPTDNHRFTLTTRSGSTYKIIKDNNNQWKKTQWINQVSFFCFCVNEYQMESTSLTLAKQEPQAITKTSTFSTILDEEHFATTAMSTAAIFCLASFYVGRLWRHQLCSGQYCTCRCTQFSTLPPP